MKLQNTLWIVGIIAMLLFTAHAALADITPYEIVGNSVQINDSQAYIAATPHTLTDDGWVELSIQAKQFTGDLNIVFGFDTDSIVPKKLERAAEISYESSLACNESIGWYNYTLSPKYAWCWSNENDTLLWEHSFESADLANDTIYFTETYDGWQEVGANPSSVNYDFNGKNKWFYFENVPFVAGETKKARMYLDVVSGLDAKYDIAVYPSSYGVSVSGIQQAITNNHFYLLDPWVATPSFDNGSGTNFTHPYYFNVVINHSLVDSDLTNFPVYVKNGSAGFWGNTTDCGELRVTNSSGDELPREIVSCNVTTQTFEIYFKADKISSSANTTFTFYYGNDSLNDYADDATYGAENVWSAYYAVYHGNDNTDSAGNYDLTLNSAPIVNGMIGKAIDASTQKPIAGSTSDFNFGTGNVSFSIIKNETSFAGTFNAFMGKSTNDIRLFSVNGHPEFFYSGDGGNYAATAGGRAPATCNINQWCWTVLEQDAGAAQIISGANNTYNTTGTTTIQDLSGATQFTLGSGAGTYEADVVFDEIRIMVNNRTYDWFESEYANLYNPSTFYSITEGEAGASNTAPSVTTPSNTTAIYTNTNANFTTTYTDADSNVGNVTFEFSVEGTNIFNDTILNVATGTTVSSILYNGNFTKNQNISVLVYATDGTDYSDNQTSSIIVTNSLPTVTAVNITPDPAITTDTLTGHYTYSDADGDTNSSTYRWFKDDVLIAGQTSITLPSTQFIGGDDIIFEVTSNDGAESGTPVNSSALTITATPPTLNSVSITTADGVSTNSSSSFNFTYNKILTQIEISVTNVTTTTAKIHITDSDGTVLVDNQSMTNFIYAPDVTMNFVGAGTLTIYLESDEGNVSTSFTLNVIQYLAETTNGLYAYDYNIIPAEATIDADEIYGFTTIGMRINYSNFDSDWNTFLSRMNYTAEEYNANSFLTLYYEGDLAEDGAIWNNSCTQATNNISDLTADTYFDQVRFIVIRTNQSTNWVNFTNEVARCVLEATNTRYSIYSYYNDADLDGAFISDWTMPYITGTTKRELLSSEQTQFNSYVGTNRVYYDLTADRKADVKDFQDNIFSKIRSSPAGTNTSGQPLLANNDLIVFNPDASSNIFSLTGSGAKDVWDVTNQELLSKDNSNFSITLAADSYAVVYLEDLGHLTTAKLWKGATNQNAIDTLYTGAGVAGSFSIVGANEAKITMWDPTYLIDSNIEFHTYEVLNYSYVTNFSEYGLITFSKGSPTSVSPAELNSSLNVATNAGILNRTFGYVSVADYNNSAEWTTAKEAEADEYIDDYLVNIFIDGLDTGVAGENFTSRLKDVTDYIRYQRGKLVILNDYTAYQEVSAYGDYDMKESFCGYWSGTVGNPTYTYENVTIDRNRALWARTSGHPQIAMAFGAKDDYEKLGYCYAMYLVLYGKENSDGETNYFRYAQPDFQVQEENRVIDVGSQLENTWTETNATYWYRTYENGIVWVDTTTNTWGFENGRTIETMDVCLHLQHYIATPSVAVPLNFNLNDGTTYQITYDEIGATQWSSAWVCKDVEAEYSPSGRYDIRIWSSNRGSTNGVNLLNEKNNRTNVRSAYDTSLDNYPSTDPTWTYYGRSGVGTDYEVTNWNVKLNVSDDITTSIVDVDTISNRITNVSSTITYTINSSKSYNLSVWGDYFDISSYTNVINNISYNGTALNYTNNSDCIESIPTWTDTIVNGETHGVCTYVVGSNIYVRFKAPHLSEMNYTIDGNSEPVVEWVNQTPSDLNTSNVITQGVETWFNVSDSDGDVTSYTFYYKTNDSASDVTYFINGTAYSGFFTESLLPNSSVGIYDLIRAFNYDNDLLPAQYPIDESAMENTAHSEGTLDTNNEWIKINLYNVSTTKNDGFFEAMINTSGTTPMRAYYCNASYTTGSPITSNNCANFYNLDATATYNHAHSANSKHQVFPFQASDGFIEDVKITASSQFLLRGVPPSQAWTYYYIGNNTGTTFRTTNDGVTWTGLSGTLDAHLHQFSEDETFYYLLEVCDDLYCVNSTMKSDVFELSPLPPSAPAIITPTNTTYYIIDNSTTINITYQASISNFTTINRYNITLLNDDFTYNSTITTNNSDNTDYLWDASVLPSGYYIIEVTAIDNLGYTSNAFSENFTIINASAPVLSNLSIFPDPVIKFAPVNLSGVCTPYSDDFETLTTASFTVLVTTPSGDTGLITANNEYIATDFGGVYSAAYTCVDNIGQTTTSTVEFTVADAINIEGGGAGGSGGLITGDVVLSGFESNYTLKLPDKLVLAQGELGEGLMTIETDGKKTSSYTVAVNAEYTSKELIDKVVIDETSRKFTLTQNQFGSVAKDIKYYVKNTDQLPMGEYTIAFTITQDGVASIVKTKLIIGEESFFDQNKYIIIGSILLILITVIFIVIGRRE